MALVSRPRLLLAVTHPMTADLLLRGQLAALAERGYEVAVLCSPGPRLDAVAAREGARVLPVPMRREIAPAADALALLRALAAVRRFRPHLVNAGTPKAGALVSVAARVAGVPRRLYTVRGLRLETSSGLKRRLLRAGERAAAGSAHRVLFVSPSLRRRYLELGLVDAGKTALVGDGASNGVDVERFRPADGSETALRAKLGLPTEAPVVGFVGRFTRDKGIGDLTEAFFEHVLARVPAARLLLLGDWEAGDPVAPEVRRRLESDPRVLRPGFVADTAPYYRLMTVLAFPSRREGFPNAPLEAAASGVPVAGYTATGTVDAVDDGVTGTLVPVGDRPELARALVAYLESPELARGHGAAGRRRAVERFSNHRVWQAWCDLYAAELTAAGIDPP